MKTLLLCHPERSAAESKDPEEVTFEVRQRDPSTLLGMTALVLALLLITTVQNSLAQTGNDNPTGPSGIFNGDITTAGDYDPYTTNVRRSITDIVVSGAVGTQPLALVRTYNSRNPGYSLNSFGWGGWQHNYDWRLSCYPQRSLAINYHPSSYTVAFPDGRAETFAGAPPDPVPWPATGTGVVERFMPLNTSTMKAYLLLNDGSQVEFTATQSSQPDLCDPNNDNSGICTWYSYTFVASAIIDPYGLRTTLTYNANGLLVKEPAGRTLQFYNTTTAWGDKVIDHVTASDGRTVQYSYVHNAVSGATTAYTRLDHVTYYGDNTLVAQYAYVKPNVPDPGGTTYNGIPLLSTCIDSMYAGSMWMIAYTYATGNNADGGPPVYGQILSEKHFNGTTTDVAVSTLAVNNNTHTRTETRGDGPSRTFTYTGNLLTSCTDFKGVTARQTYDANNFIQNVTDRNSHTTTYAHNAITGNVTQVTFPATPEDAPGQGTISYTYSDPNNPYYLSSVTGEAGHITYFDRDGNNRVWRIRYPDGSYETFAYNGFGQVTSHLLTTGGTETFAYTPSGLRSEYRDPYHASGNPTTRYLYDGLSRLIQTTDALGTSTSDPTHSTSYTYNSRDQVLITYLPTDPNDLRRHTITNAYNPNGNGTLASVTDELNHITSYTYDDYKRLYQATTPVRGNGDSNTNTTTYFYTRWGTTNPYLQTTNFVFAVASPSGRGRNIDCDANFRISIDRRAPGTSDEATTFFYYDNAGNLNKVTDPRSHSSSTSYDERNRPYQVTDALSHTTTNTYDGGGRRASVTRPNGQVITYNTYDGMNRLTQMTATQNPNPAAVTKYTYDPTGGKLQTMTDPNTNVYTYGYDLLNRKTSLKYPDTTTESWTYDNTGGGTPAGNGLLYQFKNRAGNLETFTYDNLNRVTLSHWNDGVTPDVSTGYDAANRVTSIVNANSTITRAYYNDNLLNTEANRYSDGINRTVTYTYDPDGRRSALTYPNSAYNFSYTYTQRGQLQTLASGASTIATYGYDLNGNMTGRTLDNGTTSTYVYNDPLNRCTSISHALTGTTRTFAYGYDTPRIGNLGWVKRDGANGDAFDYDLGDQSTAVQLNIPNPDVAGAAGAQTIVYDPVGNRKTFSAYPPASDTYAVNNLNQYTTRNSASASYDANGNMKIGLDSSTYTYDAQNRLLTASTGGTKDTFLYDGLNRQIGKQIGSGSMYYRVYDGWDLLGEYKTGTSNAFWAYLYGASGLVKNVVTNNYYYQDAMGSTSHLADNTGALIEWYRYDLQGTPTVYAANGNIRTGGSNYGIRHLFTGQQWYTELGLYDLRNRYYSPDIGRFIQADPIRFLGDRSNIYRYCRNNPVTHSDPAGLYVYYYNGYGINTPNLITPTGTNIPIQPGSDLGNPFFFPANFSSSNGWGSGSNISYGPGGGGLPAGGSRSPGGGVPGGGVFYSGSQNNGSIPYDTYSYGSSSDPEAGIGVTPAAPFGSAEAGSFDNARFFAITPSLSFRNGQPLTFVNNMDPQLVARFGSSAANARSLNQFANFMDTTVGAYAVIGVAGMTALEATPFLASPGPQNISNIGNRLDLWRVIIQFLLQEEGPPPIEPIPGPEPPGIEEPPVPGPNPSSW